MRQSARELWGEQRVGMLVPPPPEAWWSVHRRNTLDPFLIFPFEVDVDGSLGKVTIHRAEESQDSQSRQWWRQ